MLPGAKGIDKFDVTILAEDFFANSRTLLGVLMSGGWVRARKPSAGETRDEASRFCQQWIDPMVVFTKIRLTTDPFRKIQRREN